jgi:hypothetical protein
LASLTPADMREAHAPHHQLFDGLKEEREKPQDDV